MGRGGAHSPALQTLLLLLSAALLSNAAQGVIHTVGGASKWDLDVDYVSWAATQTFKVGDVLFFPYVQTEHNVAVIDKAGYDACSAANAIDTYSAGNTNITLTTAGAQYYMCSVIGHCQSGMKLAITVSAAAAPASPPASSPVSARAPAPTKASPSPAPAPASAPSSSVPAPAPASSPLTAPSSSVPAPAPAPASSASTPLSSSAPAPSSSSAPTPSLTLTPNSPPSPPSPPPPNAAPFLRSALDPLASVAISLLLAILAL